MEQTYTCPLCKSTKTIKKPSHMNVHQFVHELPYSIICGVRGCLGQAVPGVVLGEN